MTSAVVSILSSIDRLSPDEQQEIVLGLLERMSGEELNLESKGLSAEFQGLDREGMRSVLMTKLAGNSERSFFEMVGDLIGAGEGPGDLSTNSDYLKGYGCE